MGSGLAWGALAIGLAIVIMAVGIPYFLTHRRMREPRDLSDSHAYLRSRRRWVWRRQRRQERPGLTAGADHNDIRIRGG